MAYGRTARFEPLREVAFGAIGAGYAAVGSVTTDYTRIVWIKNGTDKDVFYSDDGVTNKKRIYAGSLEVIDISSNKVRDDGLFLPKNSLFYIKHTGAAPTSGQISIEVMYASGGV